MSGQTQEPLLVWTLSFLRPYRTRVTLLALLLLAEIGLGALQPWPLAVIIDYVLERHPVPEPYARWLLAIDGGDRFRLLIALVSAGVLLQVTNQFVSAYGTQVQVETGQRMVYDLRRRHSGGAHGARGRSSSPAGLRRRSRTAARAASFRAP